MASTNNISKKRKVDREEVDQQEEIENATDYVDGQNRLYQQEDCPGDKPASASEDEDEDEDEDDISDLLEPLSRDQLITLLRSAAASNPNTLAEIRRFADLDPSHRKIFVHGLSWGTDSEALRSFFSQYGDIDDCKVVTDRSTGKSKGFGFVLFQRRSSARNALKNPQKQIDGRMTACQLASVGPTAGAPPPSQQRGHSSPVHYQQQQQQSQPHRHHQQQAPPADKLARKIYVGNVHADIDGNRLLDFFSRYGEIEEGPLGFDRHTGRPKGFALFIYRTVEGARKALEEPNKNFDGHLLYCQKSTDSSGQKKQQSMSGASPATQSGNSNVQGGVGYNLPSANAYNLPANSGSYNASMDMGLAQGMLGGSMPFGQGMPANAAAFAMLAAQNPAAFGVSPALLAQFNPALAAAMSAGAPQMAMQAPVGDQSYAMANSAAYQNAYQSSQQPISQSGVTYQPALPVGQASTTRPPMGSMGGYASH